MPTVLLVGDLSDATTATLRDRGFAIDAVDRERLLDAGGARDGESNGVHDDVQPADCALVSAGAGDERAIGTLADVDAALPVLYAVEEQHAAAAGKALRAGADDRVLLTGERDGQRIAARIRRLDDVETNGTGPDASSGALGPGRRRHDGRVGVLLEGAKGFMDAETTEAVAETAVETAERALGYHVVGVRTVDTDEETLRLVARSDRADEVLDPLPTLPLGDSVLAPAYREQRTLVLEDAELTAGGLDSIASALVFPIGEYAVMAFGSTEPDAFGEEDRHVGELLAANAESALDRIHRVESIEAVHTTTQEMLDATRVEDVADRAIDAAKCILGYPYVVCYLADDDTDLLDPVAWTDETDALVDGDLARPGAGHDAHEVYRRGAVVHRDAANGEGGVAIAATADTTVAGGLYVPIEGHGSLLVATPERRRFDESDVQLARVLASNTARMLDRVERTQELERLETVFETVNDMVYVHDENGYILHCTPVLAERLGYGREELIGTHVSELVDDEAVAEGANLIQELLGEPRGATRTQRLEFVTDDGGTVPVELDVSLLPGEEYRGVVGTVRDISDLLDVQQRLDSQQDRFEYLFDNIPDPVVEGYFEDEAIVDSVNNAFEETFGYCEEELAGEALNDVIVPDDDLERARRLDEQTSTGAVNHAEVERDTQYGHREFLFRGVPYEATDGSTRGFGIYTDITDQKERERHLEVLQRLLRHNVRNEVNVLLAGIDQLDDARDGGEGREAELLDTLEDTAKDLLSMSQKAKRISKVIDAEDEALEHVDAASIARSVVERYRQLDTPATFEIDAPERCDVVGTSAIERALEELIGNALEHAGDAPTITITLACDGEDAELTVADDGPGIPDAEREVLEDGEITPLKHGSGLGLWLVTHATAASGGTVSFDERVDGASVTLSFRTSDGS